MEITRGSLDEITRPAGNQTNRPRPGSRVSLNSAGSSASYRHSFGAGSSLEILPPEDISFQEHDIEVEEFSSESEDEVPYSQDDIGYGGFNNHHLAVCLQDDDPADDTASSTPEDHNDNHAAGDSGNDGAGEDEAETDPNDNLDPKIVEAMRKMRQLDRLLAKKIKREKEVKRQRLELHQQLQRELEEVKPEGRDELKEVSDNTTKFLALVPPSSHNEGVPLEDELPSVSPVFATQPLDTGNHGGQEADGNDTNRETTDGASTNRSAHSNVTSDGQPGSGRKASKKKKSSGRKRGQSQDKDEDKPDFIKRNIELATDAGNLIAMTDDEKKRLEELLQEVEMLADEEETANPFQLQIAPGIGYQPDDDEKKMLQTIDSKLRALIPTEDFMSISSTPIQELTHGFVSMSMEAFDLGEKALQDNKQVRSQQERLQIIEEELSQMQNTVEKEMKSPRISDERLKEILRQCDDLSSRATSATSSYIRSSPTSPRSVTDASDTNENIPKLPDDVLKHLLDEAREAGITTNRSLSTVNEEEEEQDTDFESEAIAGRQTQVGVLVSYDMIQELLKNPRATSVASSEATSAMDSPRSIAGHISPTGAGDRPKTPVSSSSRSKSGLERSLNNLESGMRMGVAPNSPSGQRQVKDTQRSSSRNNSTSVHSQRSSYDQESTATYNSVEFESTARPSSRLANIELPSELKPPKTRGSSRIAFAESNVNSQFDTDIKIERKLPNPSIGGDTTRLYSIPTPPQISHSSPSPQKSKPPSSSRSRKSKSRAASRQKSVHSPGQATSHDQDLILTSVLASASCSSVGRTDSQASTNTLVSSSDFEYENEEEVMQLVLRATPGDEQRATEDVTSSRATETPPFLYPLPKLNRGVHGSKPTLPVDRQRIQGIESYAQDDDDSEKPFSPVFF